MSIEPRFAPASFLFTSVRDDNSGGTLRAPIGKANADPATADTRAFLPSLSGAGNLSGTLFTGNSADKDGDAIALDAATALTLQSATFSSNSAARNGRAISATTGGAVTVTGATFRGESGELRRRYSSHRRWECGLHSHAVSPRLATAEPSP